MTFRSGYVNIIGKPNVGKSTLMNVLVGEKLSIISPKAQTTRKRILGIVSDENSQIVFSDTPGIIDSPEYKLHSWMNDQVKVALQDADIILFMTDPWDRINDQHEIIQQLNKSTIPVIVIINKTDAITQPKTLELIANWKEILPGKEVLPISAQEKTNIDVLLKLISSQLPEHPPYFDPEEITDQSERFIAAEIVREKIFYNYKQEIPYSVEVAIEEYKDKETLIAIRAVIYVSKETHKSIIIGKGGLAIKKVGIEARLDIEKFTGRKIFLELFVKVKENWKNEDRSLKYFGYN
ncbi:MAG: GTPase Era [Chitinophagales bacterium]|jgi:GTP-binding protein Era|nr:GTPase Era [Bacteroidota bacterium]MBK7567662.1 GTPase Era [Bacteroidota bacterium]MBP9221050.1 GTPase Era [Chitinophagales bacterium]